MAKLSAITCEYMSFGQIVSPYSIYNDSIKSKISMKGRLWHLQTDEHVCMCKNPERFSQQLCKRSQAEQSNSRNIMRDGLRIRCLEQPPPHTHQHHTPHTTHRKSKSLRRYIKKVILGELFLEISDMIDLLISCQSLIAIIQSFFSLVHLHFLSVLVPEVRTFLLINLQAFLLTWAITGW